jgi:5'-deoxynucleotidase YfbR-like HD superfamily hydrolase
VAEWSIALVLKTRVPQGTVSSNLTASANGYKKLTDTYIADEIEKLRYTYGLNKVIRYNQKRKEEPQTQSVAEHVTNSIFLAYYFRDFEDPNHELDFDKVIKIIMMHDMGEIETGDIMSPAKKQHQQ